MKYKKTSMWLSILIMVMIVFSLHGCKHTPSSSKKNPETRIIVAKSETTITRLYYKGTLSPLKNIFVLSPVEGSITKLFFKYGDFVQKNELLALIDSTKLADDYRQAVTKFLQAKDTYETGKQTYAGTVALYKAGVISANEYATGKSQYETNALNYYQAQFDLEKILTKANIATKTIESLSIVDTEKVNQILQRKFSNIEVRAPESGVALFPVAMDSTENDKTGKLMAGSQVKEGQLILSIGDLSGFSITLPVSEVNINKIKPGLKAMVTGDAFPGIVLAGVVTSVANQANPDQPGAGGGLSLFNIEVQIPNTTEAQRKIIHVGMTAMLEIDIDNPPRILVPIKAVSQQNGHSVVTIIDAKTQRPVVVPVITGETTLTDVVIVKGIQAGDRVVVHD